jgi:peroxiredoxin
MEDQAVERAEKLDSGDSFPQIQLNALDGSKITLPDDIQTEHAVVLFYRGHW